MWKHFTIKIVVVTLAAVLAIGGFNWLVDPLGIFGSPAIAGFNANKPEIDRHDRLYKAVMLQRRKPRTILIGTSCTASGMDPQNENFDEPDAYNCAVPAGLPTEYEYYIDAAVKNGTKQVIIGADFFTFYAKNITEAGFGDFAPRKYLLSLDAFRASIRTIGSRELTPYLQNGRKDTLVMQRENDTVGGHKKRFQGFEENRNPLFYTTGFSRTHTVHWQAFQRILDKAFRNGIRISIFISPSHAALWERIDTTQGWEMVEDFKRKLVAANEQAAQRRNKTPFVIWDFSGYHELTTEIPPDDSKAAMKWHWDPVHYKKELGDIALDRMFGGNFAGGANYPDFGVTLTGKNIDAHLSKLRGDRARWKSSRPGKPPQAEP